MVGRFLAVMPFLLGSVVVHGANRSSLRSEAAATLRKAVAYFRENVATEGGYLRRSRLPDGRLARFYELQTNRPLYCTKDYGLTYSDQDTPTHYVFKVTNRLDSLEKAYRQVQALPASELGPKPYQQPKSSARPSRSQVQQVIDSLDNQGRWVAKGRLRYQDQPDLTDRIIDCRTFINNCRILSTYLAAETSR